MGPEFNVLLGKRARQVCRQEARGNGFWVSNLSVLVSVLVRVLELVVQ